MRVIKGACHCGSIRYEFTWPLAGSEIPVRACSCDFCTKHRGTYTSHPDAALDAVIADEALVSRYTFATGTADFYVCRRCGVVPFATSRIDDRLFAVVNVNTFDATDPVCFTSEVADFDGESAESRLARRKRTWIGRVTVGHQNA
ncbi:MAG: GFA family protein [Thermoanaerobaculales bacterium]